MREEYRRKSAPASVTPPLSQIIIYKCRVKTITSCELQIQENNSRVGLVYRSQRREGGEIKKTGDVRSVSWSVKTRSRIWRRQWGKIDAARLPRVNSWQELTEDVDICYDPSLRHPYPRAHRGGWECPSKPRPPPPQPSLQSGRHCRTGSSGRCIWTGGSACPMKKGHEWSVIHLMTEKVLSFYNTM